MLRYSHNVCTNKYARCCCTYHVVVARGTFSLGRLKSIFDAVKSTTGCSSYRSEQEGTESQRITPPNICEATLKRAPCSKQMLSLLSNRMYRRIAPCILGNGNNIARAWRTWTPRPYWVSSVASHAPFVCLLFDLIRYHRACTVITTRMIPWFLFSCRIELAQ